MIEQDYTEDGVHCSIAAQSRSMSGSSATIFDSTVCSVQRVMPLKEVCGRGGGGSGGRCDWAQCGEWGYDLPCLRDR